MNQYDFTQLDALKKKLDALRPFDAELYQKIKHKLQIDWTYNSNAIEGNTLTLSETRFFLEQGLTSKGKPLSEYLEMKNHKHALEYLEEVIQKKEFLTEGLIKDLHAMLFERNEKYTMKNELGQTITKSVLPGSYKKENNYVLLPDGSIKYYMDPLKCVDEMQNLIRFYDEQKEILHPVVLASELHTRFVAIHPFVDGNGRVARLIMNIVLMQAGYEPVIIQNELKQEYYETLRHYDDMGDIEPFVSIVEKEAIRTLQITLRAAEGESIFDTADIPKRLENFTKTMHALEKDVGKYAKKVTKEEKENSIRSVRDYLYRIAQEKIEGFQSELFQFTLHYPLQLQNIAYVDFGEVLNEINVITELTCNRNEQRYVDFIEKRNDGSAFGISLESQRAFIPHSYCAFAVIPSKYTLYVCYAIVISDLNENGQEDWKNGTSVINFIQNGILWEDWNKQDLDNLFTEVFEQYLAMIQDEAEKRRIHFEEKKIVS